MSRAISRVLWPKAAAGCSWGGLLCNGGGREGGEEQVDGSAGRRGYYCRTRRNSNCVCCACDGYSSRGRGQWAGRRARSISPEATPTRRQPRCDSPAHPHHQAGAALRAPTPARPFQLCAALHFHAAASRPHGAMIGCAAPLSPCTVCSSRLYFVRVAEAPTVCRTPCLFNALRLRHRPPASESCGEPRLRQRRVLRSRLARSQRHLSPIPASSASRTPLPPSPRGTWPPDTCSKHPQSACLASSQSPALPCPRSSPRHLLRPRPSPPSACASVILTRSWPQACARLQLGHAHAQPQPTLAGSHLFTRALRWRSSSRTNAQTPRLLAASAARPEGLANDAE